MADTTAQSNSLATRKQKAEIQIAQRYRASVLWRSTPSGAVAFFTSLSDGKQVPFIAVIPANANSLHIYQQTRNINLG